MSTICADGSATAPTNLSRNLRIIRLCDSVRRSTIANDVRLSEIGDRFPFGLRERSMADVVLNDLKKSYGLVEVIHGVNLTIKDGEFVVLVGPSGCGKSTLLRMIAGLESVTSGDVMIGGGYVNDLAPSERDIAMVFQSYALYPHKTVEANMSFSLKIRGTPKSEIKARVAAAAEILGLTEYLDRRPRHLSGGQRQRVAMGRAIVRNPTVFLFDEPLSNLDAKLRVQMRAEIRELHDRLKTTTIYVTHDQIEAMTMADRIVIMQHGNIEQIGKPLELYDNPRNLFVATFIGSPAMNMFEGTVTRQAMGLAFYANGFALPLPQWKSLKPDMEIMYGVRPEHVMPGEKSIVAEISHVEPTGSETLIYSRVAGRSVVSQVRERFDFKPGDKVSLGINPDNVHLFDKSSGERIDGN